MTDAEIRAMPAGREMDTLVATAMGWTDIRSYEGLDFPSAIDGMTGLPPKHCGVRHYLPRFSNCVQSAINHVLEWMHNEKPTAKQLDIPFADDPWVCLIRCRDSGAWHAGWETEYADDGTGWGLVANGETAALAACRAALLWQAKKGV